MRFPIAMFDCQRVCIMGTSPSMNLELAILSVRSGDTKISSRQEISVAMFQTRQNCCVISISSQYQARKPTVSTM